MKLEEVFEKLTDDEKQEVAKLTSDEEIINFMKNCGYDVEINQELSDDELENVTGGNIVSDIVRSLIKSWFNKTGKETISNMLGGEGNKVGSNFLKGEDDKNLM